MKHKTMTAQMVIDPLIAVLLPWLGLFCIFSLFHDSITAIKTMSPWLLLVLLLIAVLEIMISHIIQYQKLHTIWRFILMFMLFAVIYVLMDRFFLQTRSYQVIILFFALAQWFLTSLFIDGFRYKEMLLDTIAEITKKSSKLQSYSAIIDDTFRRVLQLRTIIVSLNIISFIILFIAVLNKKDISRLSAISLITNTILAFIVSGKLNNYFIDVRNLFNDITLSSFLKQKRLITSVWLLSFSLVIVVALSLSNIVPNYSHIVKSTRPTATSLHDLKKQYRNNARNTNGLKEAAEKIKVNTFYYNPDYFLYGILAVSAILGLMLLILNLRASKVTWNSIKKLRPHRFIIKQIKILISAFRKMGTGSQWHYLKGTRILALLKMLFSSVAKTILAIIKTPFKLKKTKIKKDYHFEPVDIPVQFAHLLTQKVNPEKRNEINKVTKAFVSVIHWGIRHGLPYQSYMAPKEYIAKCGTSITCQLPHITKLLEDVSETFEESMFSNHTIGKETLSSYLKNVQVIINTNMPETDEQQ